MRGIKLIIGLAVITAFIATSATVNNTVEDKHNGIEFFHGTWKEAVAKAKKEDKLIFVDAYTTWCGPCKWMSKNAFKNPEVGEFFNDNFICVKVDCEKGEGIKLADEWNINAYPTLLALKVTDGKAKVKKRNIGALDARSLLDLGKKWAK